ELTLPKAAKKPRFAFLGYASFHDGRNMMLRGNHRAWITNPMREPEMPATWLEKGELRRKMVKLHYDEWPLERYSALVARASEAYNKSQVITHGAARVSQALILRFSELCKQNGVTFVLLGVE